MSIEYATKQEMADHLIRRVNEATTKYLNGDGKDTVLVLAYLYGHLDACRDIFEDDINKFFEM